MLWLDVWCRRDVVRDQSATPDGRRSARWLTDSDRRVNIRRSEIYSVWIYALKSIRWLAERKACSSSKQSRMNLWDPLPSALRVAGVCWSLSQLGQGENRVTPRLCSSHGLFGQSELFFSSPLSFFLKIKDHNWSDNRKVLNCWKSKAFFFTFSENYVFWAICFFVAVPKWPLGKTSMLSTIQLL